MVETLQSCKLYQMESRILNTYKNDKTIDILQHVHCITDIYINHKIKMLLPV